MLQQKVSDTRDTEKFQEKMDNISYGEWVFSESCPSPTFFKNSVFCMSLYFFA